MSKASTFASRCWCFESDENIEDHNTRYPSSRSTTKLLEQVCLFINEWMQHRKQVTLSGAKEPIIDPSGSTQRIAPTQHCCETKTTGSESRDGLTHRFQLYQTGLVQQVID